MTDKSSTRARQTRRIHQNLQRNLHRGSVPSPYRKQSHIYIHNIASSARQHSHATPVKTLTETSMKVLSKVITKTESHLSSAAITLRPLHIPNPPKTPQISSRTSIKVSHRVGQRQTDPTLTSTTLLTLPSRPNISAYFQTAITLT